jgi:DNA-binding LacI/PurR family transcriptional regulator
MAETFLRRRGRATAILAVNDRVALGLMHTLQEAGVDVPAQVSIIGYDNADFTRHTRPPLATIDPRVELLISAAVDLLQAGVEGNPPRPQPILVHPVLVPRASLGPASTRQMR